MLFCSTRYCQFGSLHLSVYIRILVFWRDLIVQYLGLLAAKSASMEATLMPGLAERRSRRGGRYSLLQIGTANVANIWHLGDDLTRIGVP